MPVKSNMTLYKVLVAGAIIVLVGSLGLFVIKVTFNKNSLMAEDLTAIEFESRHTSLEVLRQVFATNPSLDLLAPTFATRVFDPTATDLTTDNSPLSPEQLRKYRSVLESNGVLYVSRDVNDGREAIYFAVRTIDLDNPSHGEGLSEVIGYVYSEHDLSPLLDSLEDEKLNGGAIYQRLRPNWYIFRRVRAHKPE